MMRFVCYLRGHRWTPVAFIGEGKAEKFNLCTRCGQRRWLA